MTIYAGIDAGSRAIKVALWESESDEIVATAVADQGVRQDALAGELFDRALSEAHRSREDVAFTVATGYARNIVSAADTTVTEITCHARGVRRAVPGVATVVEIGGQDSKLIRLGPDGAVRDFAMNDRCAAGTGRFLEMVAQRLDVPLDSLGDLARRSTTPAAISSMCVVFAETEIISLLAAGTSGDDIVAGVQASIASRVTAMAGRNLAAPVVFTGGVALVPGMDRALGAALACEITVAPHPQFTGAVGAALLAARHARGPRS